MPARQLSDRRIGQILLAERFIDRGQLEQALAVQGQQSVYKPLGEVLKDLCFISARHLRAILASYRKQILLGQLFVNTGIISQQQLDQALDIQKAQKQRLGNILVDLGFVTRFQLLDAVCVQTGVKSIRRSDTDPDKQLLNRFNTAFLRRKRVLPLKYDPKSNVLTVLVEDPSDAEALTDLSEMVKAEIEPVILRDWNVEHLLDDILDVWHRAK